MHLLEASRAWEELNGDPAWVSLSDHIVTLALTRFIDADIGRLREFFDADWRRAPLRLVASSRRATSSNGPGF